MSSHIERFVEYALAFEQVLQSDEWERLEPFFCETAERHVAAGDLLGEHSIGRRAVIDDLHRGVDVLDRRFDHRIPEITAGPEERDGAVWISWRLTLRRAGLPELRVEGTHATSYEGDRIARIDEVVAPACDAAAAAYLARHETRLRRAGDVAGAQPGSLAAADLGPEQMRALVEAYAAAKSRADVDAALALCTDDFSIDTVSFGVASRDKAETELHLRAFFAAFPDYAVRVDGIATGEQTVACWGRASLTMRGALLGIPPTQRRVELPIFCAFEVGGGQLRRERFFFDLATLCRGLGLSIDTLTGVLRGLGSAPGAAAA